ncbi:FecR family protein [Propionivibrio dicarboxylicus]|uniref:FecR family protein n=1 Tax=Propionivibrio dicarboxylicus TaxID=83767 RepID=A0A1G8AEF7_9RHOO|nr:FecR family protein [Propionivibrio dicarboxylicus]SDH19263.1 FecR family protein [Propionivibrio dicarboxylicus]
MPKARPVMASASFVSVRRFFFLAACCLASVAGAQEVVIGTVTHLSGVFSVQRADGAAKMLSVKSEIREGDLLKTEDDTYARIKFVDGGEVVLRPNTQFKVEKYGFAPDDADKDNVAVSLLKGGMRAVTGLVGKRSRDKVNYSTAVATIGIRGTNLGALFCQNDCGGIPTVTGAPPPNGLHVDVAQGAIVVTNGAGTQQLNAGQFGFVGGPAQPPVIMPPNQGIQVTIPPAIAINSGRGLSPAAAAGGSAGCAP